MPSYNSGSMRWNEKNPTRDNYGRSGSQGRSAFVPVGQKNAKNASEKKQHDALLDSSAEKASNRSREWGYTNRHTSSTHYAARKYGGGYHEAPKGKGKGRYYEQSSRYKQFPSTDSTNEQKRRESDTSNLPMRHPVGQKQQKENLIPEQHDDQSTIKPNEADMNGAKNNRNQNNHSSQPTQVLISDATNHHQKQEQLLQEQQHALGKPHVNKTPTVSFPNITEEWEHRTELNLHTPSNLNLGMTMMFPPTPEHNIGLLSMTAGGMGEFARLGVAGIFTPTNAPFDGPDGFFVSQGMQFDPKRMEEQHFLNQENAPPEEMDLDWDLDYSLYKKAMSTNPLSTGRLFVCNPMTGTMELSTASCNLQGYFCTTQGFHPWLGHRQEPELRNAAPLRYRD